MKEVKLTQQKPDLQHNVFNRFDAYVVGWMVSVFPASLCFPRLIEWGTRRCESSIKNICKNKHTQGNLTDTL